MQSQILHFALTLAVSVALALYLTPIVRRGAIRFGVLDHPDGGLKRQEAAVPYLGGVAVYLAFVTTLALVFEFDTHVLGLLLGGTMMVMLGLFDDMRVLPPGLKLIGQVLAASVLVKSGIYIQLEFMPLLVRYLLTVLWLVTVTNAVNIIDVSDGLAASTTCIAALVLGIVALLNGDPLIAITAVALVGSIVGVLRFNWPPAKIYLGDAGSLFIGFMLAALSMLGAYTRRNMVAVVAPLAVLIVPLAELALVSITRVLRRRAPWRGSGDHFALRLKHRGWSRSEIVGASSVVSALGASAAIVMILGDARQATIAATVIASIGLGLLVWIWRRCPPPY